MKQEDKHKEAEELKGIAPHLFGEQHKDGFQVPDGFFDDFSAQMAEQVAELKQPRGFQGFLQTLKAKRLVFPTAFAGLATCLFLTLWLNREEPVDAGTLTFEAETLEYAEHMLAEDDEFFEEAEDWVLNDETDLDQHQSEEIEAFLLDEGMDVEELALYLEI